MRARKDEIIFKFGTSDIKKVLIDSGLEQLIMEPKKLARIREVCRKYFEGQAEGESLEDRLTDLINGEAEELIREERKNHFDQYHLDESIRSVENMEDGALETYGHDLERVKRIYKDTPNKVWTVMDGEGGLEVVSGMRFVNRVHYLITLEDCKPEDEDTVFNY